MAELEVRTEPVVVGTDGSATARAAVRRAMELAEQHGAPLHIVRAYSPAVASAASVGGIAYLDPEAGNEAERCLAELAAEARARGIACETFAIAGGPADALLDVAEAHGAGCIVVGSRGMHGARRVLGSVPNSVSHRAGCDVFIVRTD